MSPFVHNYILLLMGRGGTTFVELWIYSRLQEIWDFSGMKIVFSSFFLYIEHIFNNNII